MLFWAIVSALAAIITIFPIIQDWIDTDIPIEVSIENVEIKLDKKVNIIYALPKNLEARLTTLPFPVIIKNRSKKSLEYFYVRFESPSRLAKSGDFLIRRLVPLYEKFPEIRSNEETKKLLSTIVFSKNDSINIISNQEDGKRSQGLCGCRRLQQRHHHLRQSSSGRPDQCQLLPYGCRLIRETGGNLRCGWG